MKPQWLLLALLALLVLPGAQAIQYTWVTSGTFATHELPEGPIPVGETFIISGTARGTGATDEVELGVLDLWGCTLVDSDLEQPDANQAAWHALLRMDNATCSWARHANFTDDALGGTEPVSIIIASGTVAAYTLTDFGQEPSTAFIQDWLPMLLTGALFLMVFFRTLDKTPLWLVTVPMAFLALLTYAAPGWPQLLQVPAPFLLVGLAVWMIVILIAKGAGFRNNKNQPKED